MAVCPNCHEQNSEVGGSCLRCPGFHYIPEEALEDAEHDPLIGRLAAEKYVVLSMISEGGMGAVYRALQLPVDREVALKVLRAELEDSDQGRDRFVREARAVSRLRHPNIITLHDSGFDEKNRPYMVMEYAPGQSLHRWLRHEHVTLDRILHIAQQVLGALCEAHEAGIVHRDLKPENMIVTRTGNDPDFVKLLDFGIARLINEGATRRLTREGEVFGTPHYMAPEQAQGKKNVGPPVDVYAMGIMLFEMITGYCPFDAETPLAVLFMHINDELPPLIPRAGIELPPRFEALIRKATQKDPADRYQSAGEMLTALSQFHRGYVSGQFTLPRPTLTTPTGEPPRPAVLTEADASAPTLVPAGHSTDIPIADPNDTIPPAGFGRARILAASGVLVLLLMALTIGLVVAIGDDESGANEAAAEAAEVSPVGAMEAPEKPPGEVDRALDEVQGEEPEVAAAEEETPPEEPAAEDAERDGDEAKPEPKETARAKEPEAAPSEAPEKSEPAAKPRQKQTRQASRARDSKPAKKKEEPRKFQPTKFAPKKVETTSEPRKFEPKF